MTRGNGLKRQAGYVDRVMVFMVMAIVALIAVMVAAMLLDDKEWSEFSKDHDCKKVAHIRGDVFNTISSSGSVGIGMTPDKTGWLCDDGMTYYR